MTELRNGGRPPRTESRRIVFVAAPGTEILDLVGPLQVFARAAEMFGKQNPGSPPIYSVEVISASSQRSLEQTAACGSPRTELFEKCAARSTPCWSPVAARSSRMK